MDQTRHDIFAKLEAAIDRWSTELAEAQSGLAREVARARDLFQGREEPSGEAPARESGGAALSQSSLDALVSFFHENCETLRSLVGNLLRWEEAATRFHGDVDSLDTALSRSPDAGNAVSEGLESLRTRVEEVRERVVNLPGPAEALEGPVASLRGQLAQIQEMMSASQEPTQRAQEDLNALRAEIAELSKRPAPKVETDPHLVGQIENLSAELGLIREIVAGTPELEPGVVDEIRSLRAEVLQIRDGLAQVGTLRERVEALGEAFQLGLAQLEARFSEGLSRPSAPVLESAGASSGPQGEEAVEVAADAVLRADVESAERASMEKEERRAAHPYVPPFQAFGPDGSRRRLGEILLAAGVISDTQLERALAAQENSPNKHLGSLLVEMGLTGEDVIAQTLACQLGLAYVKLDPESIAPEAARLIRSRLALRHKCIPLEVKDGRLVLAIANPLDLIALEDVERAAQLPVEPVVASSADIAAAIEWCYRAAGAEEA